MPKKIEISHKTVIFTVTFLIVLWFLYQVRDIILAVFVALLIMAVLNPFVTKLSKYRVPRALSVIVVYLISLATLSVAIAAIVPPLIEQTSSFITNLPKFMANIGISASYSEQLIGELISQLGSLPARIARFVVSLFSNILGVATILVFAFYLLATREELDKQIGVFLGEERQKKIARNLDLLEHKLGGWARAQIGLMLVVGISSYAGLTLLDVPYSLPLAILAGLLEIIPYVGPVIAAIPAVIIGFGISPVLGFATVALAFIIQQLENYIFVPKIIQRSVGVNPIVTMLALAIGFRLAGIPGLLISVPVFLTLQVVLTNQFKVES